MTLIQEDFQQKGQRRGGTSPGPVILGVLVILAGVAAFIFEIFTGITKLESGMTRFLVPGSVRIKAEKPAGYDIFHEYRSVLDGKEYETYNMPPVQVKVTHLPSGKDIAVGTPSGSSRYNSSQRSGHSFRVFRADEPGEYEISAFYDGGAATPQTVFAVSGNFTGDLLKIILNSFAIALTGIAGGAVIIHLGRRRAP
jgi:hypothetical protein